MERGRLARMRARGPRSIFECILTYELISNLFSLLSLMAFELESASLT
jgi:hypothetical protein